MHKSKKFLPEICERAVCMVQDHDRMYPSLWEATEAIAVYVTLLDQIKRREMAAVACGEWLRMANLDVEENSRKQALNVACLKFLMQYSLVRRTRIGVSVRLGD